MCNRKTNRTFTHGGGFEKNPVLGCEYAVINPSVASLGSIRLNTHRLGPPSKFKPFNGSFFVNYPQYSLSNLERLNESVNLNRSMTPNTIIISK